MFVLVSQVLSFRLKKHTSKNVADTTFKLAISWSWVSDFSCYKIFFKLGFTPCKDEQPLHGMELQKKKHKKIKAYKKSV